MPENNVEPEPPSPGWSTLTPEEADFLMALGGELQARRRQAGDAGRKNENAAGEVSEQGIGAKNSLTRDLLLLAAVLGLCALVILVINTWLA